MEIIKKLRDKDPSPATKSGELKYNDIFLIRNDDGKDYLHIFLNNKKFGVVELEYNDAIFNKIIQSTWTVERNGTTVKSNSFINYNSKTIRLTQILKELNLPPYHILDEEYIEENMKLYYH